jgi:mono/diheme cytochrome c family protein
MQELGNAIRGSFVVGACAAVLAAGCGSGDTATKTEGRASNSLEGFESFHPQGEAKTYYTGFDGTNDYVAPIAFFADAPPAVAFGDPSVAELKGRPLTITKAMVADLPEALDGKLQLILVKSKKAGQTSVTATSGKISQQATLKVTGYTAADVTVGQQRYEVGSSSCTSCHANLGVHNPTVLVDLSDETILGLAVEGKSIQKISMQTGAVETLKPNGGVHKWVVTPQERTGLMAYLRSRSLEFQLP